ncbi:LysR family transcriptional regulator [Tabrizicola sp.]|uniref:LysR family transcriptional regulator n=1 Tax=Tabrizicola sp. TaxID=2005166 RepID=UPI003F3765BE
MTDLRLIYCFIQSARQGSFTAAAKVLGISPAAVSQNIRALEDELQTRLFTRTTRQIKLTPEGARFLQRCAPAVEALAQAVDEVQEGRDALTGRLRITSTTQFGRRYLLPEVVAFQAAHPGLEIELHFSDSFVDLVANDFDLAIRIGILPENEYIARLLLPITPLIVAAPSYLVEHGAPATLDDLAQHCLIGFRAMDSHRVFDWEIQGPDGRRSLAISPTLIMNDPEAIGEATAAGAGIAQVGTNVCLPLIREGRLVVLFPETAVSSRGVYAVWPTRRYVPAKLQAFIRHLTATFSERADLVWRP